MSNADKAKQMGSSLLAKTKTNFARTKQKALEVLGKAEKIVDINYNQERERFNEHYKAVQKINKDAARVLELLRDLTVAQATLAEDFHSLYDTSHQMYNAALKYQDVVKFIDNARAQFDDQMRQDALDPTSKYIGQFKEIKDRNNELDTRRVDVERYTRDVKIYREKGNTPKLSVTEPKLEAAKTNYVNLYDELMNDMPALYNDRAPFFDPFFATYLSALAEFYRQSAKTTSETLPIVAHVSRGAIHEHPRIVTTPEESAAAVKATPAAPAVVYSTTTSSPTGPRASTSYSAPVQYNDPLESQFNDTPQQPSVNVGRSLPVAPKPLPPKKVQKAQALYDFNAQDSGELPFRAGDIITIHATNGEWWEGEINGKKGLLPNNYVQLMQ